MFNEFWAVFIQTPLFGILLTLLVYAGAAWLAQKSRFHPLVNPVAIGVLVIVPFLVYSGVSYESYMNGAQYISFLLGPATMPIAMGVSEKLGGLASLASVGVMGTGIFGVMVARYVFRMIKVESPEIRGFMLGLTTHGIGVARGFQISNEMGAFAGLGMSLNGLLTAFLVPVIMALHFVLF